MEQWDDPAADWRVLLKQSITRPQDLPDDIPGDREAMARVAARYPMRINPYYLGLVKTAGMPLYRQAIPHVRELDDAGLAPDPLAEISQSPVPHLVHRYPDRVLFHVSDQCALFCRHCMRKRDLGKKGRVTSKTRTAGIDYIARTPDVRDVILSGGDPLMLPDDVLIDVLMRIRAISHVSIIRIHSRMPCVLPQRITPALAAGIRQAAPVYVNTHFNHPAELTRAAAIACGRLADAGIPVGCQTVLLSGVNDEAAALQELMRGLLAIRVKPYYLHHPDPVRGTAHFRVPVSRGRAMMRSLRGQISGMGIPQYVIDLPGGRGKVPVTPDALLETQNNGVIAESTDGRPVFYPTL